MEALHHLSDAIFNVKDKDGEFKEQTVDNLKEAVPIFLNLMEALRFFSVKDKLTDAELQDLGVVIKDLYQFVLWDISSRDPGETQASTMRSMENFDARSQARSMENNLMEAQRLLNVKDKLTDAEFKDLSDIIKDLICVI